MFANKEYTGDITIEERRRIEQWFVREYGICWVSDFNQMTWKDIMNIRNIGKLSAAELRKKLGENGIELPEQ